MFELGLLALDVKAQGRDALLADRRADPQGSRRRSTHEVPDELADLEKQLADSTSATSRSSSRCSTHWALGPLFPIVPIHRLDEEPHAEARSSTSPATPTARSTSSSTCATSRRRCRSTRSARTRPYYLGMFLTGAYQDIMGDIHNLFGDVNEVHVDGGRGRPLRDRGRSAGRDVRARPRVHELRSHGYPGLHQQAARRAAGARSRRGRCRRSTGSSKQCSPATPTWER